MYLLNPIFFADIDYLLIGAEEAQDLNVIRLKLQRKESLDHRDSDVTHRREAVADPKRDRDGGNV